MSEFRWKTKGGKKLLLSEMSLTHLRNTAAMLRRQGYISTGEFVSVFGGAPPNGEMAQVAYEQEMDAALESMTAILDLLDAEIARRTKK